MSYTPTLVPSPVPHPVVLYKHKTHLPSPSAFPTPTPTGLGLGKGKGESQYKDDIPYGSILVILCLLCILARINKSKKQHIDSDYTGIQMHQMYTLDPVRRRRV